MGFMKVLKDVTNSVGNGVMSGIGKPPTMNEDGSLHGGGHDRFKDKMNIDPNSSLNSIGKNLGTFAGNAIGAASGPSTIAKDKLNHVRQVGKLRPLHSDWFNGSGETSKKLNSMFESKTSNLFGGFNMDLTQFGLSKTKINSGWLANAAAAANGQELSHDIDSQEWTSPLLNRYVQEAAEYKRQKRNDTMLDTWFKNVDGMTKDALDKSKIGIVISGINTRTIADRILSHQKVIKLESVDQLNEQFFRPFEAIDWREVMAFGKNAADYFKDPSNLMNVTLFGTTPKLLGGFLGGKSSSAELADYYLRSINAGEEPEPHFNEFCDDLQKTYAEDRYNIGRWAAHWEYFKSNRYSMGLEQLENFETKINKAIDGFGDLALNELDHQIERANNFVNDTWDKANNFASSFGIMLNPNLKSNIDNWMKKKGFTVDGKGNDTVVYLSDTIVYYTMVEIDDQKFKGQAFEHFWELHDYIDTGKPTRVIRMNFSMEEAKQLNFEKDKMKVKIQRRYGFPHTQNAYNFSANGGAIYHIYDELLKFIGKPKIISGVATQKEIDAIKNTDSAYSSRIVVEFELIPEELYENAADKSFNAVPKDTNISTLISTAFTQSFGSGQLAITPPKNDLTLTDYAIPPSTFPQLLQKLQSDFNIYDGGGNIFTDKGITYIMNRRGPNEIRVENVDWVYRFEVKPKNTMIDTMQTILKPSAKSVKMSIYDTDIIFPMDRSEYEPIESRWNKGSVIGSREKVSKNPWSMNASVTSVNHDYFLKVENENKPVYDFIIRVPNTFISPVPCDDVEVSYKGKTYLGSIKKWASEMHKGIRAVVLYCTSKEGKSKVTQDESTPIGKLRKHIEETTGGLQNKVSDAIGKIKDKIIPYANKEGERRDAIKAKNFAEAVKSYNNGLEYDGQVKSLYDAWRLNIPHAPMQYSSDTPNVSESFLNVTSGYKGFSGETVKVVHNQRDKNGYRKNTFTSGMFSGLHGSPDAGNDQWSSKKSYEENKLISPGRLLTQ